MGQRHAPEAVDPENHRIDKHCKQRGDAHHGHAASGPVGEPTPYIGGDDLGGQKQRHQLPDLQGAETEMLEIQAPVRDEYAEGGEEEEIKPGQAPIWHVKTAVKNKSESLE